MVSTVKIDESILDLSSPKVMSIINVTPDSFYSPSRHSASNVLDAASSAINDGAAILDIGGCSTRPGVEFPTMAEEYNRVREAFSIIREAFPYFPLSLDTFRADIVRKIVDEFGPVLVNDISGGQDPEMFHLLADYHLPYILCHINGTLETMHQSFSYDDIISDMLIYFAEKVSSLLSIGVYDVIIDPNFGFSKDVTQNFKVVADYHKFLSLGLPLMAGISRKRFVSSCAGCNPEGALSATSAIHMALLERGAKLLRVHDTQAAISTINLYHGIFKS